jgi:hypothetical protein
MSAPHDAKDFAGVATQAKQFVLSYSIAAWRRLVIGEATGRSVHADLRSVPWIVEWGATAFPGNGVARCDGDSRIENKACGSILRGT